MRKEALERNKQQPYLSRGMALFMRAGMKGWGETISALVITESTEDRSRSVTHNDYGENLPPGITDRESVVIISNMILGALQEVHV